MKDNLDQSIAESVCKRVDQLSGERSTWESHWQEVAERVLPSYSTSFLTPESNRTQGEKRTEKMLDATAALGLDRFAAVMESMLTPRNSRWHRLRASDAALNKDRAVRSWFDTVADLAFKYRYAPKANYQSQQHETYLSLGAFGTGAMFIDELDAEVGLRYKSIHLGTIYFLENHQGIIDTAYRKFTFTARQAVQKWGEACPDRIQSVAKDQPDRKFEFVHCVRPRDDVDTERVDYKGMPWASYYVSVEGKTLLEEGGYNTFPYAISRYTVAPGETYGRSPAMLALPSIKVLNEQKKIVLKQGHRTVDPIIFTHDDGVLSTVNMKPGAHNVGGVSADGRPLFATMPVGNLSVGMELMEQERMVINDAFLITLFQILTESPQMTATEVLERVREKGMLLSPTMGRQQSEALGPQIEREIDILSRLGVLPPMPPALVEAQGEYTIEYDSPLSRAQRAEEAAGLMRTIEMTLNVVNVTQNPEPLDHFDWDVIVPEIAEIQAVPMRWMRDPAIVQQRRDARAEQADTQTLIDAAPAAAAMMKVGADAGKRA